MAYWHFELQQTVNQGIQAHFAEITHKSLKVHDPRINLDKPPRVFKEAMKAIDSQAWAAAYNLEYIGFKELGVFKVVLQQPGIKMSGYAY